MTHSKQNTISSRLLAVLGAALLLVAFLGSPLDASHGQGNFAAGTQFNQSVQSADPELAELAGLYKVFCEGDVDERIEVVVAVVCCQVRAWQAQIEESLPASGDN